MASCVQTDNGQCKEHQVYSDIWFCTNVWFIMEMTEIWRRLLHDFGMSWTNFFFFFSLSLVRKSNQIIMRFKAILNNPVGLHSEFTLYLDWVIMSNIVWQSLDRQWRNWALFALPASQLTSYDSSHIKTALLGHKHGRKCCLCTRLYSKKKC